jgi:cytochrome c oxidase subunit 3
MAGTKNHDYHILPPDIWPLVGAMSALTTTTGGALTMHSMAAGKYVLLLGFAGLVLTFFSWFSNIITEAHAGDHTPVVQLHLRYGMILFIASEVMFFVGWFWAFFDFSLFPSTISKVVGGQWPPKELEAVLNAFDLPLLNTMILLCSGTTVTWAHHCLIHGDREGLKKGLWATILLGMLFTSIQAYEYAHAPFHFGTLMVPLSTWRRASMAFMSSSAPSFWPSACFVPMPATSPRASISALKRLPGIGISLTSSGCSCSLPFMSGAIGASRPSNGRRQTNI